MTVLRSIEVLSLEIIDVILNFLSPRERGAVTSVCRGLRARVWDRFSSIGIVKCLTKEELIQTLRHVMFCTNYGDRDYALDLCPSPYSQEEWIPRCLLSRQCFTRIRIPPSEDGKNTINVMAHVMDSVPDQVRTGYGNAIRAIKLSKLGDSPGFRALRSLPNLTDLVCECEGREHSSALTSVADLTQLTHLSITGSYIRDMSSLANLHQLRVLICSEHNCPDLTFLSALTGLTHLDISGEDGDATCITTASLEQLKHIKCLEHLNVSNLNTKSHALLPKLLSLRTLICRNWWYLENLLPSLARNAPGLRELDCSGRSNLVSFASFESLAALTCLTRLECSYEGPEDDEDDLPMYYDISPLSSITQLRQLRLESMRFSAPTNFDALLNLSHLRKFKYETETDLRIDYRAVTLLPAVDEVEVNMLVWWDIEISTTMYEQTVESLCLLAERRNLTAIESNCHNSAHTYVSICLFPASMHPRIPITRTLHLAR